MNIRDYKDMRKEELFEEINVLINATHFIDEDKELFLNCIEEWGRR